MTSRPLVKFLGICMLVVLGSLSILATGGGSGGSGGSDGGAPNSGFGVVAFIVGGIGIVDANQHKAVYPLLVGELGSSDGGLLDVAITPDGLTDPGLQLSLMPKCISSTPPAPPTPAFSAKLPLRGQTLKTPWIHFLCRPKTSPSAPTDALPWSRTVDCPR